MDNLIRFFSNRIICLLALFVFAVSSHVNAVYVLFKFIVVWLPN